MDRRTTGIIATVVAALLCGCPGLILLFAGVLTAGVSQVPGAEIDIFGSNDPQTALSTGLGTLCLGLLFVAIPFVVGFITLRRRPAAGPGVVPPDEPLPPAS